MGDLSQHFDRREFRCKHCQRLVGPDEHLVTVLQRLRTDIGRPLRIVSGYRCPEHNRAVGSTNRSQHPLGRAVDVPWGSVTVSQARAAGVHGCGVRGGLPIHLDVRAETGFFTFRD